MAKYSYEFKKEVVLAYLNGEGGYKYLSKSYGIPSEAVVRRWVHNYEAFGDDGLKRSHEKQTYSFERKLSVVKLYLSGEISYCDLAAQEGIMNSNMIADWVQRFRKYGPDALRPHRKGRKKTLDKPEKASDISETEERVIDTNVEHVKELEKKLYWLRLENAFLKEMRRLRLEDEAKMRERRSSSTVSEENSD